jgi:hypothetical protein
MFFISDFTRYFMLKVRYVCWHVHGLREMKFCRPLFALGIVRQDKDFIFNPWQLPCLPAGRFCFPARPACFCQFRQAGFSFCKENEGKKKSKLQLNVLTIIASSFIKLYKKPAN